MNLIYRKFYNQIKSVKNKKIVFWGASLFLEGFLKTYSFEGYKILGIVDNNKQRWGQKLEGFEIISPEKINTLKADCVIISILNLNKETSIELTKQIKKTYPKVKLLPNILLKINNKKKLKNIKYFLKILDFLLPKNKRKIVFFSNPDFTDNAREYYEYIKENHKDEYELIWLFNNTHNHLYDLVEKKYSVSSLEGIWHTLTANYFVFTHTNFLTDIYYLKKHKILQLWHGMPLKTLGFNERGLIAELERHYKDIGENGNFFVTSDLFKLKMIASFLMDPKKVYITGQPRTDCIFLDRNSEKITEMINKNAFDKVIIYAPTYKEALRNNRRDVSRDFNNIFYCDDYSESEFYKFLEENNILFIVKPHPFDEPFYSKYLQANKNLNHKNIRFIFDKNLKEKDIYFYDFFKFADLMITDYSSIAIDYLITKKPVIFLCSTNEEYSANRGFILEDNYDITMAGTKVNCFKELLYEMNDALTKDSKKEERLKKLPLLHKHTDAKASERVYEIMKNL